MVMHRFQHSDDAGSRQSPPPPQPLDEALARPREPLSWRAPRTGLMKRVLAALFLLGAMAFMAANLLHPGRSQRLERLASTRARLESTMLALEHANERLLGERQGLARGAQGWQNLARKEYGMLLDGELIYRFPPAEP
jgi:cell division protein FtsB